MKFTIYPIYWLADHLDEEQFDLSKLPFHVTEGVRIEAVSGRFREGTFDLFKARLGADRMGDLESVRYALVHRYDPGASGDQQIQRSEQIVRMLAACLRLIRPMRQNALLMRGDICDRD